VIIIILEDYMFSASIITAEIWVDDNILYEPTASSFESRNVGGCATWRTYD